MAMHHSTLKGAESTLGKIPVSYSAISEADALAHFGCNPKIAQTNGWLLIDRGYAADQAHMRTDQLAALLQLMRTEEGRPFRNLDPQRQESLMWLASQIADELQAVLPLVLTEEEQSVVGGGK